MADDKMNFPYVVGTQKLANLLKKIPDIGVPDKFTLKTLKSLGFTSSNDERFLPTLKFIGLLNSVGQPTELWKEARAHLGQAIAKGIRGGYSDLFNQYPNAQQKDDEALRTYFSVHSGTGKDAVARMVQTFKALRAVAAFEEAEQAPADKKPEGTKATKILQDGKPRDVSLPSTPAIAINIQLQLPPDPTGEMYEKFFAAMAKHLPVK